MGNKDDRIYTILVAAVAIVGIVSLVLSSNGGGLSLGDSDGAIAGHAIMSGVSCSGESDGGKDYETYGEVTLDDGEVIEDSCTDSDVLREVGCFKSELVISKVACSIEHPGTVCDSGACVAVEVCDDGSDNDGDGLVDTDDPDCLPDLVFVEDESDMSCSGTLYDDPDGTLLEGDISCSTTVGVKNQGGTSVEDSHFNYFYVGYGGAQLTSAYMSFTNINDLDGELAAGETKTKTSTYSKTGQDSSSNLFTVFEDIYYDGSAEISFYYNMDRSNDIYESADDEEPETNNEGSSEIYELSIDDFSVVEIECTSDSHCGALELCSSNECVTVDCKEDSDCSSDQYCSSNTCYDIECHEDSECGSGEGCYSSYYDGIDWLYWTCQTTACSDNDGGNEVTVPGTVTNTTWMGTNTKPDSCNGDYINEYYCEDTSDDGYDNDIWTVSSYTSCTSVDSSYICVTDSDEIGYCDSE